MTRTATSAPPLTEVGRAARSCVCLKWQGATMPRDHERRDPTSLTPPLLVSEWLSRPRSMRVHDGVSAATAINWLRSEVQAKAHLFRPLDPGRLARLLGYLDHRQSDNPHHCAYGPCDALCELTRHKRTLHWQQYLPGGVVVWAIVPWTDRWRAR